VATGLNADKVDGKDESAIVSDAVAASNLFATVSAAGALGSQRGATSASNTGTGTYNVVFANDISKCALGVTVASTDATIGSATIAADNKTVNVATRTVGAGGATAADEPFHLTVTC
jgi:hypothetical protein